eukprot:10693671-Alexandrium_andersonii.AAC.1
MIAGALKLHLAHLLEQVRHGGPHGRQLLLGPLLVNLRRLIGQDDYVGLFGVATATVGGCSNS